METFRRFEARGSESALRELRSLETETDAELYFEGVNHLARRLANRERGAEAGELWAFVAEEAATAAPDVARRAREELEVLSGGGRFGRRVEFLAQRFVGEATSPTALIGMTVAGGVYTVGRTALLGRLLASPAGVLTRGFGARSLAGLGAFAVEAPAFALTTRTLHSAAGHASQQSLGHDLLASYLSLGGLKLFGALGSFAVQRAGAGGFSRAVIPTASAYLGILAGHGLERAFGLRPAMPADQVFLDSFAMLLQFQVGGRLASEIVGPRWNAWQREMQARSETALTRPSFWRPPSEVFATPQFGVAGAFSPESPARPQILMMVAKRPGDSDPGNRAVPNAPISGARWGDRRTPVQGLEELRQAQDALSRRGEHQSLTQILSRFIEQGTFPPESRQELHWAIHSFRLYENSPLLRSHALESVLASPEILIRRLHALRGEIQGEQGVPRYALATLVQALVFGGRIPYERLRSIMSASASFDLYQEMPILQRMTARDLSDPYRFVNRLKRMRSEVAETSTHYYKLSTLTEAMRWHPEFPSSQHQSYSMVAGASDFVGALSRRQLRIDVEQLQELSLEQIFLRLLHLKPAFLASDGKPVTIGYVLTGLRAHGLKNIRGGVVNDTAIQHAYALDMAQERWMEWGEYFGHLDSIPKNGEGSDALAGWRRPGFARVHLLKENGETYSDSRLSNFSRWGAFLWQHREALNLPTPLPATVVELAPGRGSALREFLQPHWERLREKAPEDFLQSMLELRQRFRERYAEIRTASEEGAEGPSLPAMVSAFYKAHQREAPGSIMNYAHQVDGILRRWQDWSGHFRRISGLPRRKSQGFSRAEYAAENLKKENGDGFAKHTLDSVVRWGVWLWEHRSRFGLSRGTTVPPPADGE